MDLNVPYEEKDAAKALGAKWDPTRRTWYVPAGVDINKFARWNPELEAWNRAADGRGKPPKPAEARSTRGKKPRRTKRSQSGTADAGPARTEAKVSYIAGASITGKHYSPTMCPECKSKLPWEPQCDSCTAVFEGRRAVARAEAGVVGSTSPEKHDRLRNTNSSEKFMAWQLPLLLDEPVQ